MSFWDTPLWHAYERASGDAPGTRSAVLAAADWQTYVVDLARPLDEVRRGLRKSYRSLINQATRDGSRWSVFAVEPRLASFGMDRAHAVHRAAAGRETRSPYTWEHQRRWLEDGHAVLTLATHREGGGWPGFAYVVRWEGWAYYFSGATTEPNLQHALVWEAMRVLHADGRTKRFELGWGHRDTDTEKDCGIHVFKSGFGGVLCDARGAGVQG